MNNEPVAYVNSMCNDYINWKADPMSIDGQPLYTHLAKELHLSLQKNKETGELLAVTYTDDEHRIVEVLWKKPPAKTLTDEEIREFITVFPIIFTPMDLLGFARAILRKVQEG